MGHLGWTITLTLNSTKEHKRQKKKCSQAESSE